MKAALKYSLGFSIVLALGLFALAACQGGAAGGPGGGQGDQEGLAGLRAVEMQMVQAAPGM